ncbi:MAG TPA: hypothetical protein VKT33_06015 [Candidatus Angelobacter sp.]|nr:hypothetical protein [Candidatus Angelobacter sp.]
MKAIQYRTHFIALAVAAVIFWVVRDFHLPVWISTLNFFHYALMGALHATCIVASLQGRKTALRSLGFIALAAALSAFTPLMALIGSVAWIPLADFLRESDLGGDAIFVTGSVIGASGYWLLVQLFWFRARRRTSWFWAVALCAAATWLVILGLHIFGYDSGAKIEADTISPMLTFAWWLAFSTSLYWSETTEPASGFHGSQPGLMRKALVGPGVSLLFMPVIVYLAALWWAPMDAVTIALPQHIRNTISHQLVATAGFGAKSFPRARRAVKLNPASEDAWTMLCATGVSDGTDMDGALKACSHVGSMTDNLFHAQIIAQAYEEAHRPCDGLPVLKKTMGQERVNNISPIFSVGRLEATCGDMENAEIHLRAVVRLRKEGLRSNNWEDRPPGADGSPDTYEKAFRLYLSEARQNLSALLTLRHKDAEAFDVCRSALGTELKRCTCHFKPREDVTCDFSATE